MRVSVLSKDALTRDGLSSILFREGLFAFTGASNSVQEAIEALGYDGGVIVATDDLAKSEWVELSKCKVKRHIKVVVVDSGAKGVPKSAGDATVARSEGTQGIVQTIGKFAGVNPRAVAEALQQRYGGKRLSKRELEVAQYVAQGLGNRRISQVLELREQSVKNLVSCIMTKLGCDNRTQVALALLGKEKPR